jgi:UDP-N-acetylmuramate--alanine ligase
MTNTAQKIHIVGIGGSGMLPLAELLLKKNYRVTGSDRLLKQTPLESLSPPIQKRLERLRALGAVLFPQDGSAIDHDTQRVVISTAIEAGNPDRVKADQLGIPTRHRAEELSNNINDDSLLAVCGTSGKSTTTAICAWVLLALGDLHSFVGGAEILDSATGGIGWTAVHVGAGQWSCLELDESDKSLLRFSPRHALILNITRDHHSFEENLDIFLAFCMQVSGNLVLNQNDPGCRKLACLLPNSKKISWFTPPSPDQIQSTKTGITIPWNHGEVHIPLMGRHNAENTSGALALLQAAIPDLDPVVVETSLRGFPGIRRRLHRYGSTIPVFDDYAHNPEKIEAALQAIQSRYARVFFIFQPHGYTPLRFHLEDFAEVFSRTLREEDQLLLLPVYDAGGTTDRDVSSRDLAARITGKTVALYETREDVVAFLKIGIQADDAVVVAGARDDTLAEFAEWIGNIQ